MAREGMREVLLGDEGDQGADDAAPPRRGPSTAEPQDDSPPPSAPERRVGPRLARSDYAKSVHVARIRGCAHRAPDG